MAMPIRSCDEVRALEQRAERELSMPTLLLMENAGRGIAEQLLSLGIDGRVAIACGKGNNGGDGFVIARHLDNCNVPVRILLFAPEDKLQGDALVNYQIVKRSGLEIIDFSAEASAMDRVRAALSDATWIVDALFGSGLRGALRPPFDAVVECINASGKKVLAVDVPSGLNADTGTAEGAVIRADCTITLVAAKKGLLEVSAKEWVGDLHYRDAGLPRCLFEE